VRSNQIAILAVLPLAILASCETVSSETSDGRPMPPPARAAPGSSPDAWTGLPTTRRSGDSS